MIEEEQEEAELALSESIHDVLTLPLSLRLCRSE
jgi:hypothetical protein